MGKALTDLFKSTNALKALICNEGNEYDIYDMLVDIEKICEEHKQAISCMNKSITVRRKGELVVEISPVRYLSLAVYKVVNDATDYINQYIRDHSSELEGIHYYTIRCYSNNRGCTMACLGNNTTLKMNGLKGLVSSFSGYKVLFNILDMEPKNIIIERDYNRFLEISKDKEYIKPYIQDILTKLHEVKRRER